MRRVNSAHCKCKKKCKLNVHVWVGDLPSIFDDPHMCFYCNRVSDKPLSRQVSGIYTCDQDDCDDARFDRLTNPETLKKEWSELKKRNPHLTKAHLTAALEFIGKTRP